MFGFNWTKAGQVDRHEAGRRRRPSPPGHLRLFGVTALAFIATLGAWKLVTSFGFRPVALAAGLAVVAATLSHPFWVPVLFGWNPAGTFDDWVGMFVVASALTGWLMAALALLLAPVRLAMGWQNARRRRRVQAREEGRAP